MDLLDDRLGFLILCCRWISSQSGAPAMKTGILKKSEGRNPRPERNPKPKLEWTVLPFQISNFKFQISSEAVEISGCGPSAFLNSRICETNPFLPNEPISTKRNHFYQTNPFQPHK